VSEDARQMLRELLAEALAGSNGNGVVPQIPPPPVAAVHRPSTWQAGEAPERVTIGSDDDLNRFARDLLARADREAILAGRVRFTLGGGTPSGGGGGTAPGTLRVDRGAVTERTVEEAARAGARLVLGPRAVLTPLAREKARAKGIEIERETH
jgi:hypothetical protein